jgi:uncharacterized protein (DUF2384 family)
MANQTASTTVSSSSELGGAASVLRLQATSLAELRDAVRSGLPFSAFVALTKQLEISPQQFTAVFGIPSRTVARRKEARQLNPQESDRLYRQGSRVTEDSQPCLGLRDASRSSRHRDRCASGRRNIAAHQLRDL